MSDSVWTSTDGDAPASVDDPFLYVVGPDVSVVAEDDDSGGDLDALVRDDTLEQTGEYWVAATSYAPGETFSYALTLQCS